MTNHARTMAMAFLLVCPAVSVLAEDVRSGEVDANIAKARELFNEATRALREGNATVGRDLLRRSVALDARVPTRYNLGVALRRTGQTTEAIDTFEGLLGDATLTDAQRTRIQEQLEGARTELASLVVHVTRAARAEIELDGRLVGEATQDVPLQLIIDPGSHVVTARAGGTTQQTVAAGPGEERTVTLYVMSAAERDQEQKKIRRRKRAGWITGGVAVVAAVVVTAVIVSQSPNTTFADPVPGDGGDVFSALRQAR